MFVCQHKWKHTLAGICTFVTNHPGQLQRTSKLGANYDSQTEFALNRGFPL